MFATGKLARSVVRAVAAVTLVVAATGVATTVRPGRAEAAACTGWAMADRYDHEAKVYGAGGLNSCAGGIFVSRVDVVLYRDGDVAASSGGECRDRPCSFSTGGLAIPSGQHSWCADTLFTYLAPGGSVTERIKGNCTTT